PWPADIRGPATRYYQQTAGPSADQFRHDAAPDRRHLGHFGVPANERLPEHPRGGRQLHGVVDLLTRRHSRRPEIDPRRRHWGLDDYRTAFWSANPVHPSPGTPFMITW